jgi:hypothetical protein
MIHPRPFIAPEPMPEGCGLPLGYSGRERLYCGDNIAYCSDCRPDIDAWRERQLSRLGRAPTSS